MSRRTSDPRPYLRAGERRTQLLDAAAAVIGREGIGGLTVAGVALEAGVSRQWVYEHFSDLDDLYRALIEDRFAALDADIDAARECLTGTALATFAARRLFALVPADRRILRALVDGAGWNRPELAGIASELRERILGRWTGLARLAGHDDVEVRAIVWALVHAAFGLADQIERESLGVEEAVALLIVLVEAFNGTQTRHRARRPSARGETKRQSGSRASLAL
ncbi:MAG TPA: TetR/AcrR family transcriptional regulator [Acidimicrobiales bacterium]|nr:TetR/AcrR family transcriptional regulator [Acidimicrobiales bacterium]